MFATLLLAASVLQAPTPTFLLPVEEEFEDNHRGWLEGSRADFEAKVEHGHYTVSKKVAGGTLYTWIGVDVDRGRPYTVRARFKIESGGDDGVGIVWSLLDRRTFNGAYVTRKGYTTWGQSVDGTWQSDTTWNDRLGFHRAYGNCNTGPKDVFEVALEPYEQNTKLLLRINGCALAILPLRYKGQNFGFVINGTARIKIESFAVTQP